MHKVVLIVLVLGIAIFSGCIDSNSKTVYFSQKYNETITLYPDHSAIVVGQEDSFSGTWKMDGTNVVITWAPFGNVHIFQMNSTHLTDKDNDTWEKQ